MIFTAYFSPLVQEPNITGFSKGLPSMQASVLRKNLSGNLKKKKKVQVEGSIN